jgi:hypothetical protein
MGSKKYKNKTCAYCGETNSSSTADHIFARQFFINQREKNPPQVPSCQKCNNLKSNLERHMTALLPFGARHEDALQNLEKVPKRLNKNPQLHHHLNNSQAVAWLQSEAGVLSEEMTLSVDFQKLEELMKYIVRGLVYKYMDVHLSLDDKVDVLALTDAGEHLFSDALFNVEVKKRIIESLGQGTVEYEGVQGVDNPKITAWKLRLYGGVQLIEDNNPPLKSSLFGAYTSGRCVIAL